MLNEAEALPGVLAALPPGYSGLVVDNGSEDGSGEIARRFGAEVIEEPRQGFGAACYAGLLAARSELVCFMDCDGSLDPAELDRVTTPVLAGHSDLVLGCRDPEPGAWPLHARIANRVLARLVNARAECGLTDLGPMRAAAREPLLELGLRDRRFGWPAEMVVRAAAAGWRIGEVEVSYRPRAGGRSKVTGTVRGTVLTVYDMSRAIR